MNNTIFHFSDLVDMNDPHAVMAEVRSIVKGIFPGFDFARLGKGSLDIVLSSAQRELTGKMLGTADLLGQMADRTYLEKLGFLYEEFVEGNVPGYSDELDLFRNTIDFYNHIRIQFDEQLGGVYRFAQLHFKNRHKMDRDLYLDAVESNLEHVRQIVKCDQEVYRNCLRRRSGLEIQYEPGRNQFCME